MKNPKVEAICNTISQVLTSTEWLNILVLEELEVPFSIIPCDTLLILERHTEISVEKLKVALEEIESKLR